jgi:hypothetical protein
MTSTNDLRTISDEELLRRLSDLLKQSRRIESDLVAHIGEVDERRLYAPQGSSSMFTYCTDVLHLSEHEAYLRITAARASRRYPVLLAMLEDGRLHLSGVGKLAPHLTDANCEEVLARAAHKSKREIEELVAELAPRPDVPSVVRKLPAQPEAPRTAELGPDRVTFLPKSTPVVPDPPTPPIETRPVVAAPRAIVQPLAPARYKVQFTASAEFREKLERLTALMRPSVPDGDLAAILEQAVTEKLERLEAKRFAETRAPRKNLEEADTSPDGRYIPAPVKRIVRKRDSDQCTFVDDKGRRCPERRGLEFHHRNPYGLGGDRSPENTCLMCRARNAYLAELDYGKGWMGRYRARAGRVCETAPEYFAGYMLAAVEVRESMRTRDA